MSAYLAILSARFRVLLQYRAAAVSGFSCQLFWGLIRVSIFTAFYHSTSNAQPMTFSQVVVYTWLGQAMLAMFPWNVDPDIRAMINSGSVAYELLRPVDLYSLWFTRALAMRTAPTILRAVPLLAIAGLFFGLTPPPSLESGLAWIGATTGALLLSCAITTLLTISLLWTVSGNGIERVAPGIVLILSGMIVPIPFFPKVIQRVIQILPFNGLVDIPFRLYTGHLSPQAAPLLIS
jgi:ABC-2 type transport system permease protein